jgi:hypothetical protein
MIEGSNGKEEEGKSLIKNETYWTLKVLKRVFTHENNLVRKEILKVLSSRKLSFEISLIPFWFGIALECLNNTEFEKHPYEKISKGIE